MMRFYTKKPAYDDLDHQYEAEGSGATIADRCLDAPRSESPSPFILHDRVPLAKWLVLLVAADSIGVTLIALLVFRFYVGPLDYGGGQIWACLASFLIGWIVASWTQNLYGQKALLSAARIYIRDGLVACAIAFCIVLLLGLALKFISGISRVWLLTWALSAFVWLGVLRALWAYCLRRSLRQGKCIDRVFVLAASGHARRLSDDIGRESRGRIGVVSAMGIPGTPGGAPSDWLDAAIREGMVDRVIIGNFECAMEQSGALLARLMRRAVDVTLIPSILPLQARMLRVDRIGMLPTLDLASRPLSAIEAAVKRAEDLFLSCLVMLLTAPLFGIIAFAIKLDSPGPVLFGQLREGYHNKVFKMWKFRTMYHEDRDDGAVQQTSRNDRRVTRVGRILRRFSLDELPQLINVIRREMSVVGPRPHALGMTFVGLPMTQALEGYAARLRLRPGITGWAQVNGCRGEVDLHEKLRRRVSLDCYYIDHWSLSLDLRIILRTAALLLFDSDAY